MAFFFHLKFNKMAKKRVLARVGIKAKKNELVYYKDGVLYAVERKEGGTKGAKHKCSAAPAKKKKTATKKRAAAKKKTTVKKKAAPKKSAAKKKTAKRPAAKKRRQLSLF